MTRRRIGQGIDGPYLIVFNQRKGEVMIGIDDSLTLVGGNYSSRRMKKFDAVVGRRIVTGGNLDPSGGLMLPNQNSRRWRRGDITIQHVATDGCQTTANRLSQHCSGRSSITSNHNRARALDQPGKRHAVSDRQHRIKTFTYDASQSRNAYDGLIHLDEI